MPQADATRHPANYPPRTLVSRQFREQPTGAQPLDQRQLDLSRLLPSVRENCTRGVLSVRLSDGKCMPSATAQVSTLSGDSFSQPCTSSFFEAVSGRSHNDTCAGCIVSRITPTSSLFSSSRSVSSRSLAEKAPSVFAASYFLR